MERNSAEINESIVQQNKLLTAFSDAVTQGDHEFALQITQTQEVMKPYEILEYVIAQYRSCADLQRKLEWRTALQDQLALVAVEPLQEDEEDAICNSIEELRKAEEAANNWRSAMFKAEAIGPAIMQQLRQTPEFSDLERYAVRRNFAIALDIAEGSDEKVAYLYRATIDKYLYAYAEALAASGKLQSACEHIDLYASSPDVAASMRGALDKHVYEWATEVTLEKKLYANAKYVIEAYGSTPDRCVAMLRELDRIL